MKPITDFVITDHAAMELERRGLTKEIIRRVLAEPEQGQDVSAGRIVLRIRMEMGQPAKQYFVRVFVDIDRRAADVVTAYRTSKLSK